MQMVNFGILLFLLNKFLFRPLGAFLKKRETIIQDNLDQAEQSRIETETQLEEQKAAVQKAYKDAKEIRESAKEATEKEKIAIIKETKNESEKMLSQAKTEIQTSIESAKNQLSSHVGLLAVDLSEKIMRKKLDNRDQEIIIKEYLESVKN